MGPFIRIASRDEAWALVERFNAASLPVVLDIETTGLERTDTILSVQLCQAGNYEAYYLSDSYDVLEALRVPLVLHNFKFDFAFLLRAGVDLRNVVVRDGASFGGTPLRDTMLMHHLLDENAGHSLDELVQEKWNDNYKEAFWGRNKTFQEAPSEDQLDYACRDVVYTGLIYSDLAEKIGLSGVPESLVIHIHRLALALYDTEVRGVRVDLDYLVKTGDALTVKIDSAHEAMRAAAPEVELVENEVWLEELEKRKTPRGKAGVKRPSFNWDSGKQLQQLIYGELGVKPVERKSKTTKKFSPTLDDGALEELADAHPVIALLRDYRGDQKVFGSFIEGTLSRHVGGRIYPSFHVNGTVTGRISSSNPNLQQLPSSGGVRGIYCADDGHLLVGCDYSQLEVVVAAHYSHDPALLKIINEGVSKHDITAEGLGVARQTAKKLNFAIGYGATEFKVKEILGCSQDDARGALRRYWEVYAGEKKVIDECSALVDKGLPIVSMFGRQRHFPAKFINSYAKQRAYRQAYNSLIQGTGSDITHRAFYETAAFMETNKLGRALFEVHDEIIIQAHKGWLEEARDGLVRIMTEAGSVLSVKLGCECSEGAPRWTD
jgi:DNA polymerase-1